MDDATLLVTLGGSVIGGLATALLALWKDRGRMEAWVLGQLRERDTRIDRLEKENTRIQTDQLREVIAALQGAGQAMTTLAQAVKHSGCPRLEGVDSDTFRTPHPDSPLAARLGEIQAEREQRRLRRVD